MTLEEIVCLEIADKIEIEVKLMRRKDGKPDVSRTQPGTYERIGIGSFDEDSRWFESAEQMEIEIV